MTTSEIIAGFLCGIALASLAIGNVMALYFGYTKADLLLEHFKNSSSTISNKVRLNTGVWDRLQLVGSACVLLTFPKFYIKQGILDEEDYDNFPRALKRKLIALQWSVCGSFAALAFLVGLWKFEMLK